MPNRVQLHFPVVFSNLMYYKTMLRQKVGLDQPCDAVS